VKFFWLNEFEKLKSPFILEKVSLKTFLTVVKSLASNCSIIAGSVTIGWKHDAININLRIVQYLTTCTYRDPSLCTFIKALFGYRDTSNTDIEADLVSEQGGGLRICTYRYRDPSVSDKVYNRVLHLNFIH